MRLIRHLNEQQVEYEGEPNRAMFEVLKRECGPYLKEAKKFQKGKFLWRGSLTSIKPDPKTGLDAKPVRKGRTPRDIPVTVHRLLDQKMKKKFGWKPRSEGVFATSAYTTAADFGIPYLFFPAGKFKFVYGIERQGGRPISDVLGALDRAGALIWTQNQYKVDPELSNVDLSVLLDGFVGQFTNKNLAKGVVQGAEIMFDCSYYYLAEQEDGFSIAKLIWG